MQAEIFDYGVELTWRDGVNQNAYYFVEVVAESGAGQIVFSAPHVTLQSPDTVFVNDDDDAHAGINDFENVAFDPSVDDDDIVPVVGGIATASMFSSCDWNGGTGTRYYEVELKSVLIRTFLMCGNQSESRMDIPLDSVDGLIRDDSAPSGGRPSWAAIGFRGHQMHGITQ